MSGYLTCWKSKIYHILDKSNNTLCGRDLATTSRYRKYSSPPRIFDFAPADLELCGHCYASSLSAPHPGLKI